jgi:ribosomal protein S12 methylthiotransferase accessory factor YcaO
VDARQRERLALARNIVRALRRPEFRARLEVINPSGERPVVAALDDDTCSWVFERVREAGGDATVVISREVTEGVQVPCFLIVTHEPVAHEDVEDFPLHPDAEIGLLLAYMAEHQQPVSCRVVAPDMTARLVAS